MITDEKKEWLETMYTSFTQALFAMGKVPTLYMVVVDGKAEVMPEAPPDMAQSLLPTVVSAYANARAAEFILHISESWALEVKDKKIPETRPSESPDRIEMLTMIIGEPSGKIHLITGEIKRASDNTPYVENWEWGHNAISPSGLVQSFDD